MSKRPPLDFDAIKIASNGKWLDIIYPACGVHFSKAPKLHQPCPMCGGNDRFRCDNKSGTGSWICTHCGSGDGFKLVSEYTNTSGYDLMAMIGGILGVGATSTVTPEQREKWKAEQVAKEKAEQQAKAEQQNAVALQAVERWNKASMTGQSDYLTRKQVMPFECRFEGNTLLVPIITLIQGQQVLRNLQTITPTGDKLFLKGGQVKGCYCRIGLQPQFDNPRIVIICEGWATGSSLYMAVNHTMPVYVAFNAGNLLPVGEVVRAMHPNARILFCADNDSEGDKNTGVESAIKACQAVNGELVLPVFDTVNNKAVA